MTFTEYLSDPRRQKTASAFLHLAQHDALWPAQSNRLEDFESFLLARREDEREHLIPARRGGWLGYTRAEPQGKHDQDLALAAWADYARHIASCSGSRLAPCEVATELLEKALEESAFEDLHHPMRAETNCQGADDSDEEDPDELGDVADEEEEEWSEAPLEEDGDAAGDYC